MLKYFAIRPAKNNSRLDKFLSETEKHLSDFFNYIIERPNIFFISSRKDIDKIWGKKTESWLCAWVNNGNIYILDPKIYVKESDHNAKSFWPTIKHEYCHLYYNHKFGINYPKWLNEGLACYLAGQVKKAPASDKIMGVFDYFQKSDWQIYNIGYFWVKLLIEKFGKKKFLSLLKELKPKLTEREFKFIFYKVYKIKFSKEHLGALLKME